MHTSQSSVDTTPTSGFAAPSPDPSSHLNSSSNSCMTAVTSGAEAGDGDAESSKMAAQCSECVAQVTSGEVAADIGA